METFDFSELQKLEDKAVCFIKNIEANTDGILYSGNSGAKI